MAVSVRPISITQRGDLPAGRVSTVYRESTIPGLHLVFNWLRYKKIKEQLNF